MAGRTQFANIPQEFGKANFHGQITMSGAGKCTLAFRPDLDMTTIAGQDFVPDNVFRGVVQGYSLPVWDANNEQLFLEMHVPFRWDGTSDISVHVECYLAVAETDAFFRLEIGYYTFTPGVDVVTSGVTLVNTNTATGAGAAQYQSYEVVITVPAAGIVSGDMMAFRLRRVAATGQECSGEIVVFHTGLVFVRDKMGKPV